ncbi:WXG100 family type VII secretion target [Umezawaea sp. NPDC059074]|uniref:WXG100 family type VII secretion target n=1 Tax=Umezawaea sp. NPDC059074 TaxID=3346716 RepID=UPI0036B6693D
MTSAENSVTKEGMIAAGQRMQEASQKVQAERQDVEDAITRLFGTFTGSAATGYRRAMTNWFGNVETIVNELNRMKTVMDQGAELVGQGDRDTSDQADDMDRQISTVTSGGLSGL